MTIPITYLRSSSYNCHDFCPMRYFGEYVLGWTSPANKKADKGTIVHKVLELLACAKKALQDGKPLYHDEEFFGDIDANVLLLNIDEIIEKVYRYYSQKLTTHKWTPADYSDCRLWTYKVLQSSLDPRLKTIVNAEPYFDIEFDEDWADYKYDINGVELVGKLRMKGTIDLVTEISPTTYEIIDYKSGARKNWATDEVKTHATLFHDAQLRLYHYAAHKLYPNIDTILMTIYFINDGGPFTIPFTTADIPDTVNMLRSKFELIRDTKIPEVKKTWKCSKFCPFGTSTFEGTNIKPLVETRQHQICRVGDVMTKCEQLRYYFKYKDINDISNYATKEGFSIGFYQEPGSV